MKYNSDRSEKELQTAELFLEKIALNIRATYKWQAFYKWVAYYRSSHRRRSLRKRILEISQNSQKTPVPVSFLTKLQALACNVIKKETLAQVFF